MICAEAGCTKPAVHSKLCRDHVRNGAKARWGAVRVTMKSRKSLLSQYGITVGDYDRMFEEQNGLCAICLQPDPVEDRLLAVDHCHSTGTVRGLLCGPCNQGLGMFKDDPLRLLRAVEYLTGEL